MMGKPQDESDEGKTVRGEIKSIRKIVYTAEKEQIKMQNCNIRVSPPLFSN